MIILDSEDGHDQRTAFMKADIPPPTGGTLAFPRIELERTRPIEGLPSRKVINPIGSIAAS